MYQHDYKALISALFLIFLDHFYLAFVRKVNFKEPYYFTFFIFSFTVLLKVLLYVVEAYATLKGIMLASELGATHVLIETDLKKLVQVVGNGLSIRLYLSLIQVPFLLILGLGFLGM